MKILITGAWKCSAESAREIQDAGHEIVYLQDERESLPCPYEEVEGVVCNGLFLYHDLKKFTSLRFIQLTSAGFDRVPTDLAKARGIALYNARGVYGVPMAEFVLCGVLQLYKQSRFFQGNQRNKEWNKHRGLLELYGKTVCIVGCGNVGTECATRFRAFGCKVIGVDVFPREEESFTRIYPLTELRVALQSADVVALTLPLTEDTRYMFDEERFSSMREGSVFVNVARGAIVKEQALVNALKGKLLGAVLDVFEEEPLSKESPLWDLENVLITPHNSFIGDGNARRLEERIIRNLKGTKNY